MTDSLLTVAKVAVELRAHRDLKPPNVWAPSPGRSARGPGSGG